MCFINAIFYLTNPDVVKEEEECSNTFLILRISLEKYTSVALIGTNFTCYLLNHFFLTFFHWGMRRTSIIRTFSNIMMRM